MFARGISAAETRNTKNESRKRFSDEQIRFLEYMFETESRPELRTKQQLANKLGLHPRQVAIWFQNKRARSKSRQIEQEYSTLKHKYESLLSKSESLKKENHSLLNQLQTLRNLQGKHQESATRRLDLTGKSSSEESDGRITVSATEGDSKTVLGDYSQEVSVPFYDGIADYGEQTNIIDIQDQLYSFESENSNWWEF